MNRKSCYCVYFQAPNGSDPLISLLFSSHSVVCSSSSPNSGPNSGPHFFHEAPQVPYCISLLLPLRVYHQYRPSASAAHLVRGRVSSRAAFFSLTCICTRTVCHQRPEDGGQILSFLGVEQRNTSPWQRQLRRKALFSSVLWAERRSRAWQTMKRIVQH